MGYRILQLVTNVTDCTQLGVTNTFMAPVQRLTTLEQILRQFPIPRSGDVLPRSLKQAKVICGSGHLNARQNSERADLSKLQAKGKAHPDQ